jgi:prolyl oligopeptidase
VICWIVALLVTVAAVDPFLWLEEVNGARALAWVTSENAKTLAVLQHDPHFAPFYAQALAINGARDRIPSPQLIGGRVYNFWQDAQHVRGVWRQTTVADYSAPQPAWQTVLDLDALAKKERRNWVWQGADCDSPGRTHCLISLSEGGEDASTVREFDLRTRRFVAGGFSLPHGKQSAVWLDRNTLLVARAWQPGDLTTSGYPYIVKRLRRARPLTAATEVFRGTKADVGVSPFEFNDSGGHRALGISVATSTFESDQLLLTPNGLRRLGVPRKASLSALIDGRLLVALQQPWSVTGTTFRQGSLVALDLRATMLHPARLAPVRVYTPGPRETLGEVSATRDRLLVTTYENVRGRAALYAPVGRDAWSVRALPLADNSSIDIVSTDERSDAAFLSVTSFLTPPTLWQVNTLAGTLAVAKRLPPRFDASGDVTEQAEAVSKDGTRIPYFIVRPKRMKYTGANPTLLYAYGGFAISQTPAYSGTLGKLWLRNGGVYVVANIRGGGEFGPAWHEAGLKTHRQRIYDDFAAVARDLIAKKITDPRHLGIRGGSNGGLLMGVELTQHPDLWNAVDIAVPLLDMLRYEQIEAGASWTGEYGTVAKPAERAFLASISPYAQLKAGVRYPQAFVWTTTKDDRVGPQHARKFAAKLASLGIPYFFYEVTEGGHGAGANIKERSFTTALEYTYFTRKLMPASDPPRT